MDPTPSIAMASTYAGVPYTVQKREKSMESKKRLRWDCSMWSFALYAFASGRLAVVPSAALPPGATEAPEQASTPYDAPTDEIGFAVSTELKLSLSGEC